ncbi:hypothetical protein ACFXAS_20675 [Streptomyces sp. NPDC059459]|uniref:hypothetical protein n=1 Tax=Streptomyces sp. NPDC059459 TaxID=3346839 RepID=UPI003676930F
MTTPAGVKAVTAGMVALRGGGSHTVSPDEAIKPMRDTGRDVSAQYDGRAWGGLAVNTAER